MGFGIHPNAGIAQDWSEANDYIFRKRMDAPLLTWSAIMAYTTLLSKPPCSPASRQGSVQLAGQREGARPPSPRGISNYKHLTSHLNLKIQLHLNLPALSPQRQSSLPQWSLPLSGPVTCMHSPVPLDLAHSAGVALCYADARLIRLPRHLKPPCHLMWSVGVVRATRGSRAI